jgi:hypothetical protein
VVAWDVAEVETTEIAAHRSHFDHVSSIAGWLRTYHCCSRGF